MAEQRLSQRQIATLKELAILCEKGALVTLSREQREAMGPLWRRGIVEMWFRCMPDEGTVRSPFFRPSRSGLALISAILAGGQAIDTEAA